MILSKKLSTVTSTSTFTSQRVSIKSLCAKQERKEIGKITLKRLQRVSTVMADQQVLDIANRRTVRKGLQG